MSHVQVDRPWAAAQQALKGSATFIVGRANSVALAPEVDDTVERNPKRRHGGLARLVAPQVSLVKGQSAQGLPGVAAWRGCLRLHGGPACQSVCFRCGPHVVIPSTYVPDHHPTHLSGSHSTTSSAKHKQQHCQKIKG